MRASRCSELVHFVVTMWAVVGVLLPVCAMALDGFETRITDPTAVTLRREVQQEFAIDGNTVVYGGVATGSELSKVFRYDVAMRESSPLCPSDTAQRLPDVSGARAVFMEPAPGPEGLALRRIVLCDIETSARTILLTDIDLFGAAIGGDRVAITHCNGACRLILMDVATPPPFSSTSFATGLVEPHPRIGGNRLVFFGDLPSLNGAVAYDIPSNTMRMLSFSGSDPDVSGDLVVFSLFTSSPHREVVVYDLTTDTIVRRIGGALGDASHPRIDGTRVVWEDTRSGSSQIWTMDLADGVEEAVSPPGHDARLPTVDANHILYEDSRGGAPALYLFTIISPGAVLRAFDEAVAKGSLTGNGPGRSAAPRLGALRNMLVTAGELIAAGDIQGACGQLTDASNRMDGEPRPPDFATGGAAKALTQLVAELQASIGCN